MNTNFLPESYMGASMLLALSTAIGNTCTLKLKNNRVERPVIFLHLVGEPGSVKSQEQDIKDLLKRGKE